MHEIKRFWDNVRAKTNLPGVRVHDLCQTVSSLLVSGGITLPMSGKLLDPRKCRLPPAMRSFLTIRSGSGTNR